MANTLTPDQQADNRELDPQLRDFVNAQERDIYARIQAYSADIHAAIAGTFAPSRPYHAREREYTNAGDTPEERARRTLEGQHRAVRAGVTGNEFRNAANRIERFEPIDTEYTDTSGANRTVNVTVDFTHAYWTTPPLRAHTEAEIRTALTGDNTAITACGITLAVTGAPPLFPNPVFAEQQREQAIERLFRFEQLRRALRDGTVSEPNIAIALEYARTMPFAEIQRMLTGQAASTEQVRAVETRMDVFHQLEALSKLDAPEMDEADIDTEAAQLAIDYAASAGAGLIPITCPRLVQQMGVTSFNVTSTATRDHLRHVIGNVQREYATMRTTYQRIRNIASAIASAYVARGATLPAEVRSVGITQNTGFPPRPGYLLTVNNHGPKSLATRLQTALNMPRDIGTLSEEHKRLTINTDPAQITGRDIAMNIVTDHFQNRVPLTERLQQRQARRAAQELFGRNATTRDEVEHFEENVGLEETLDEAPRDDTFLGRAGFLPAQWTKNTLFGSESSYIANLARGINPQMVTMMGGVNWNRAANFSQLVTAFYALRDAVRGKKLPNSRLLRRHLHEVGEKLFTRFKKDLERQFDRTQLSPEDRERFLEMTAEERARASIDQMLRRPTPAGYQSSVSSAISRADSYTGWKRRGIGRGIKDVVYGTLGIRSASIWKPWTWPAGGVKTTAKAAAGVTKAGWSNKGSLATGAVAGFLVLGPVGAMIGATAGPFIQRWWNKSGASNAKS